ncbi:mercuric reductase [Flavobacterium algicola]|uniref:mercuric reductase n=1 Tax=Flavobacterium algicola TaxID=556529 RepID=UPI001EFD644C|nr:mercuric reductase [Flavobacterium algicola]MCG9793032.1 mercuric reductase [Flavobacterium algicola]
MKHFDYIIIGSGQAGVPLAFSLAKHGTVAIIEKKHVGGTCVNDGCTPTKAYVASARRMWDAHHGDDLGIEIQKPAKANLQKIKDRKDSLVHTSRNGITKSFEENKNITLIRGEAHFLNNFELEVDGEKYKGNKIFINVGARARIPSMYNEICYHTNETILEITEIPEHLIVMGGSYIGLEFGQMFRRFGSQVTIIEHNTKLIGNEDESVSDAVAEILKLEQIEIVLDAKDNTVTQNDKGQIIVSHNGKKITGSHILLATGRIPNNDTLHLDKTEINLNDKGYIEVDDYCSTNIEGVFAIGDCNGKGAFTHTSYNDFQIVEDFLLKQKSKKISDRITTYGLFIDPPLGRVGMTKKEAQKKGFNLLVGHKKMSEIGRAKEKGETLGFMEVVIDADTKLFLGACVLGVGGDEIISGITNMMYAKQPYTVIKNAVHIHPTVSELIPTMLEDLKQIESE